MAKTPKKTKPASYRVIKYWKIVALKGMPFHTDFTIVPETKVRSDEMSDQQFDSIVEAIKASGCAWLLYTINKDIIDASPNAK